MKYYARYSETDGVSKVVELIEPFIVSEDFFVPGEVVDEQGQPIPIRLHAAGTEIPIEQRFHPDIVATLVEYDPANPPILGETTS